MKTLVLFIVLSSVSLAAQPITVRSNIFGGYTYSRGTTQLSQSRPNVHRGYTYQGRISGYSHKTLSGQKFYQRGKR